MRNIDTSTAHIAKLRQDSLDMKSSQPFFDGQSLTNTIESGNTYDFSLGVSQSFYTLKGVVRFDNQSDIVPFCKIVVEIRESPTTRMDITKCKLNYETRASALYDQGSVVGAEFSFNIAFSPAVLYMKYYAITNDTGGSFQIYPGDWYVVI